MTEPKPLKFSYSSTDNYNTCAFRYHGTNFTYEFSDPGNPAAERGTVMHDEFEQCVLDDTDYSLEEYQWILDDFRAQTGLKIPEMQLAIDNQWQPVDYKDKKAWYRGKIDFTCINGTHANVWDLKTGKRKMKDPLPFERWLLRRHDDGMRQAPKMLANARQASEYSLLIFHHFPNLETLDFKFIWSDVEGITEDLFRFDRERDKEDLHKTMLATPQKIYESRDTETWEPNPSGLCHAYCPVKTCKWNGVRYHEIKKRLQYGEEL